MVKVRLWFVAVCTLFTVSKSQDLLGNSTMDGATEFSFQHLLDTAIILIRAAKRMTDDGGKPGNEPIEKKEEALIEQEMAETPHCPSKPMDCTELMLDCGYSVTGIYKIYPRSRTDTWGEEGIDVICDMSTSGGGWTVIQKRDDYGEPIDFFYKDWQSYKNGFGNLSLDYWIGNDKIFALSNQRRTTLRFDLFDFEGGHALATYEDFYIDDEKNGYRLHLGKYRGTAGDSFTAHNGVKFTTKDKDNDNNYYSNCAQLYHGGWWFNNCHTANPHGLYLKGNHTSYADGVNWYLYKGFYYSLKKTEIKVRDTNFVKLFNQQVARQLAKAQNPGAPRKRKRPMKRKPPMKNT